VDVYKWLKGQWDRAAAVLVAVAGLVSLIVGWFGVSDAKLPAQQVPYLASNGLIGVFALGIATTLWLSADLRDEWRKLDLIHEDIRLNRVSDPMAQRTATVAGSPSNVADPAADSATRYRPVSRTTG
jgi:hypothetical protein